MPFLDWLAQVNDAINGVVWGWPMIILMLGTGIYLTVRTKFLQVRKFHTSWGATIIPTFKSIGKKPSLPTGIKRENSVSPFEAFATAISGTVGTGNIVGVTSAIMTGGPGAVFWMWISAFFGMVTNYAENVLGMYFRKKDKSGEFCGGPAYYLSEGLGQMGKGKSKSFFKWLGKILAVMAAVFCVFAAIGMSGVQTNKISDSVKNVFPGVDSTLMGVIVGVVVAAVLALVIIGGIKSIGRVASILVPFMSLIFIVMAFIIIFSNVTVVGGAFALIFGNIFSFGAVAGGVSGYLFAQVIQKGLARGIFSNEAGLGSSVIAHSASATREPVRQGLWGIFEVFFDTFIICTLTALVVLVCFGNETGMQEVLYKGAYNAKGEWEFAYADTQVSAMAFGSIFGGAGNVGTILYTIMLPLFAFTTILAWSYYGEKSVEFLFSKAGDKAKKIAKLVFKIAYVLLVIAAALMSSDLLWDISDTFNGLMALPNLIGLVFLGGLVAKLTKNYFDRKKGKNVEPMLSAYPDQNEEFKADLQAEGAEENAAEVAPSQSAEEDVETAKEENSDSEE